MRFFFWRLPLFQLFKLGKYSFNFQKWFLELWPGFSIEGRVILTGRTVSLLHPPILPSSPWYPVTSWMGFLFEFPCHLSLTSTTISWKNFAKARGRLYYSTNYNFIWQITASNVYHIFINVHLCFVNGLWVAINGDKL